MSDITDIIQHSIDDKPASLKDAFNNVMLNKIRDQIDAKYTEVANNVYGDFEQDDTDDSVDDEFDVDSDSYEDDDSDTDDSTFEDDSTDDEISDDDDVELAEEGYTPNPNDSKNPEVQFIAKHIIKQFGVINGKDFAGNSIDGPPYKGGVKTLDRNSKHGYNAGQDEKVYD